MRANWNAGTLSDARLYVHLKGAHCHDLLEVEEEK